MQVVESTELAAEPVQESARMAQVVWSTTDGMSWQFQFSGLDQVPIRPGRLERAFQQMIRGLRAEQLRRLRGLKVVEESAKTKQD